MRRAVYQFSKDEILRQGKPQGCFNASVWKSLRPLPFEITYARKKVICGWTS
jgi:hypothetical protein